MSRKRVLVGITFPSFFSVTWFTPTPPWSFSSSRISTSDMSARSWHLITPREEFRVFWIKTLIGLSINLFGGFGPGPYCHTLSRRSHLSVFWFFSGFQQWLENPSELQKGITFAEGDLHSPTRLSKIWASLFHFSSASHCWNPYLNRHRVLFFWIGVLLPLYVV